MTANNEVKHSAFSQCGRNIRPLPYASAASKAPHSATAISRPRSRVASVTSSLDTNLNFEARELRLHRVCDNSGAVNLLQRAFCSSSG